MDEKQLESLLERVVMQAPREPLSAECLGIKAIIGLLDHPESVQKEDLQHVTTCAYCQRAIVLARRERGILEADPSSGGIRLPRWFAGVSAIAAVLVVAVGLGLWLTPDAAPLLGSMSGGFLPADRVRSGEPAKKEYRVQVKLRQPAHLTFLYLDRSRGLQLPNDAAERTELFPVGPRPFVVDVTKDTPGLQWIAAVASQSEFNPFELRDELQEAINSLPDEASLAKLADRLQEALGEHPTLSFRAHRFQVPADVP